MRTPIKTENLKKSSLKKNDYNPQMNFSILEILVLRAEKNEKDQSKCF